MDVDLKVTDLIKVYDNFISLDQCDKMIDWFNSNQSLQEDGIPKDVPASDYKVCKETTVPKSNLADFLTEITIGAYNNAIKDGCPFPNPNIVKLSLNGYTIRRYKKNEGIFKPHIDQQSGDTVSRLFSILIYLNDVDEGGETEFPEWNISVSPKKGRVLLFPANYLFLHQGNVPISNDKYMAAMFINFGER